MSAAAIAPFRVPDSMRHPGVYAQGSHVIVDASGASNGRYVMAAVCLCSGGVEGLFTAPCVASTSVSAEQECILWAQGLMHGHTVWNDCIPAIESVLLAQPALSGRLYWPSPRMRKPFHDLTHALSVLARDTHEARQWQTDELPDSMRALLTRLDAC